jgi:hypothetical protein
MRRLQGISVMSITGFLVHDSIVLQVDTRPFIKSLLQEGWDASIWEVLWGDKQYNWLARTRL